MFSKLPGSIPISVLRALRTSLTSPGWIVPLWIWKPLPNASLSTSWISASSTPVPSRAVRTSSTVASCSGAKLSRVPDSKSMPKFSDAVASASAPTMRIRPETEKNQRDSPMKSNLKSAPSSPAPSSAGDRSRRPRLKTPRKACVKTTAVIRETMTPMPSVKAKPLTPPVASTKRMNAVSSVMTFASMIVPMPRL